MTSLMLDEVSLDVAVSASLAAAIFSMSELSYCTSCLKFSGMYCACTICCRIRSMCTMDDVWRIRSTYCCQTMAMRIMSLSAKALVLFAGMSDVSQLSKLL